MNLYSDLYDIIKTFDKNEKRQFKLRISSQTKTATDYGKLFDYFSGLEQWVELEQVEILRKRWGGRLITLCKGLYTWLLRIMEDMHNENTYQQLWHKLLQIEVLFHRGLYKQTWQMIGELKAAAEEFQHPIVQLFAHNWRLSFLRSMYYNYQNLHTLEDVDAFLAEGKHCIDVLANAQQYHSQVFKFIYCYSKMERNQSNLVLKELMQQPILQSIDHALSIPAKIDFYYCHQFYHLAQNNFSEMVDCTLEHWAFLETMPNYYVTYYKNFHGLWANIFLGAAQGMRWDILLHYYQKLKDDLPILPTIINFAELLNEPGEYALLLMYYKTNQYDVLKSKIPFYCQFVEERRSKLPPVRVGQYSYWLGLIFYEQGDFKQASHWLQPYLQPSSNLSLFSLRVAIRFLSLLIHYQQQEYHYLPYALRQFYRWYRQSSPLSRLEKTWLSFLKNAALKVEKVRLLFKLNKLEKMLQSPSTLSLHEKELLFYLPLEKWVQREKASLKASYLE